MIDCLSLAVTSLMAGSLLMGTLGLRSALMGIDTGTELGIRQKMIRSLRRVMPIVMAASILTSGVAAFAGHSQLQQVLAVLGFALCLGVFGITLAVHSPLNRIFLTWRTDSLPPNFQHLLDRWNRWDSIRAMVAAAAFLSIALSVAGRP
jgi:uncharacterized membrane protein